MLASSRDSGIEFERRATTRGTSLEAAGSNPSDQNEHQIKIVRKSNQMPEVFLLRLQFIQRRFIPISFQATWYIGPSV